jgi:hypothetical protein
MKGLTHMGIVDLRPVLGDRVDAAFYKSDPTVITKQGKPRAGLVPYEWLVEICKQKGLPLPDSKAGVDDVEA